MIGYGIFKEGKHIKLSYPLEQFHSDVAGRSFHNGRFIQRMREKAASLPKYFAFLFSFLFVSWFLQRLEPFTFKWFAVTVSLVLITD